MERDCERAGLDSLVHADPRRAGSRRWEFGVSERGGERLRAVWLERSGELCALELGGARRQLVLAELPRSGHPDPRRAALVAEAALGGWTEQSGRPGSLARLSARGVRLGPLDWTAACRRPGCPREGEPITPGSDDWGETCDHCLGRRLVRTHGLSPEQLEPELRAGRWQLADVRAPGARHGWQHSCGQEQGGADEERAAHGRRQVVRFTDVAASTGGLARRRAGRAADRAADAGGARRAGRRVPPPAGPRRRRDRGPAGLPDGLRRPALGRWLPETSRVYERAGGSGRIRAAREAAGSSRARGRSRSCCVDAVREGGVAPRGEAFPIVTVGVRAGGGRRAAGERGLTPGRCGRPSRAR